MNISIKRWSRRGIPKPLPLFEPRPGPPAIAGPEQRSRAPSRTSRAAAKSVAHAVGFIEQRILDYLVERGPAGSTADECEIALDLRPQTGSARFSELTAQGRIIRTDRRRPTRSGRNAFVHLHPEQGGDGCQPSRS